MIRRVVGKLPIRAMSAAATQATFPVTASIENKLSQELQPLHLEVRNESHMHNVPKNSETHFKVIIVSEKFAAVKTPLQRHRMVNAILKEELDGPVHALSIVAKTPKQWEVMDDHKIGASPSCRGGDGSLPKRN